MSTQNTDTIESKAKELGVSVDELRDLVEDGYQLTPAEVEAEYWEEYGHPDDPGQKGDLSNSTLQNRRKAFRWMKRWFDPETIEDDGRRERAEETDVDTAPALGVESFADLDGRTIRKYKNWVRGASAMEKTSLKTHMSSVKQIVEFAETIEAADDGISEKVPVPSLSDGDDVNEDLLDPERGEEILTHLEEYHPYSQEHAMFTLMFRHGLRRGTIRAVDVEHLRFDANPPHIQIRHRPDIDLPLKNKSKGERNLPVQPYTIRVLEGFVQHHRPDNTDEYGLNALFATNRSGRVCKSSIYRTATRLTCPDFVGDECDCPECPIPDGIQEKHKCQNSYSPHECRSGAVTTMRNAGISPDTVSFAVDSSEEVLEKHYDMPTDGEEMDRHADALLGWGAGDD